MKTKILGILVTMLLIATALPAFGITENQNTTNVILDELDQQSTQSDKVYTIGPSDKELAQSFTPTLPVLTKVILRLKSTGTPEFYYYYVDIKSSYLGSALTTAYIHRDTLVIGTNSCEFDFPDISVTPGTKYYIILRGVSDSSDSSKVWWWYGYPDPYAGGDAWYESISGWNYLQEGIVRCDFWFQTYGAEEENNPPNTPSKPSGTTSGVVGVSYSYSTSATDPDGDDIRYGWDWDGDGIVDEYSNLMNSGNVDSRSHAWTSTGTYNVKVKAKDEHNALSGFSSPLAVTITSGENQPPSIPIITGPTSGMIKTSYNYTLNSTDPDGDDITYLIDWGDGDTDIASGESNEEVTLKHTWSSQGNYIIKAKAKDVHGAESDWATLEVSMPKNKAINMSFLRFLENHPHLFPLLRQLMRL